MLVPRGGVSLVAVAGPAGVPRDWTAKPAPRSRARSSARSPDATKLRDSAVGGTELAPALTPGVAGACEPLAGPAFSPPWRKIDMRKLDRGSVAFADVSTPSPLS